MFLNKIKYNKYIILFINKKWLSLAKNTPVNFFFIFVHFFQEI